MSLNRFPSFSYRNCAILIIAFFTCMQHSLHGQGEIEVFQLQVSSPEPFRTHPFDDKSAPENPEFSTWKRLSQTDYNIESEETWFVFYITLKNPNPGELYLFAGSGANMDFFVPVDSSLTTFHHLKSGVLIPSVEASVSNGNSWNQKIIFNPPTKAFPIYVKASHIFHNPIRLAPHLQTYAGRLEEEKGDHLFLGIFFGVMLFLVAYHSFFFLILKDKTYAIHVLFMCIIVGFIAYHEGITYTYLFPASPYLNYFHNFLLGFIPISYILFYRSYLKLYKLSTSKDRWFRKMVKLNVVLQLIPIFIFLVTGKTAWVYTLVHIINLISIIGYLVVFSGAFSTANRDHVILLSGLSVMVIAGIFATGSQLLGYPLDWKRVVEIAVLLESIIFAVGLGYRTRRWEQEQLKSSNELVVQLKKNEELQLHFNQQLQSQVYERSAQLTEALQVAKRSAEVKSEFLTSMSHEMRTPLNGIIGLTNILKEEQDSIAAGEHLEELGDSAHDLLHLVNNVLDYSEKALHRPVVGETFSLTHILEELTDRFRKRAFRKGLTFSIDKPQQQLSITYDKQKLEQILYNLTANAIKYTDNGQVSIRVQLLKEEGETLTLSFTIQDTGIGIEQEALTRIFEPFQQRETGYLRTNQGAGLGLTVVKQTLESMGSHLHIDSQPGLGTTCFFDVRVPGKTVALIPTNVVEKPEEPSLEGKRVLLVEDHVVNQKVGLKYLKKWGITPDLAENGKEAVAMVMQNHYDMVLMDLHMPVMDGMTATHQIKSLGTKYDNLPIIALSAATHLKEVQQQVLDAGMLDFVTKPFTPKDLLTKLETYLLSSSAGV